jgi:hypothetical protein
MTENHKQAEKIYVLFHELLAILDGQKDGNWSRGIKAATRELIDLNAAVSQDGLDSARSIYNTMTACGRGFSEYFIWSDNEDERIKINKRLDDLRIKIWKILNPDFA